jgi:hypothetical protein
MSDRPDPTGSNGSTARNGSAPSTASGGVTTPTSPARPAGSPGAPGDAALPSAAPSTGARVLAVLSIVVAGICGGLIGYGIVDLQVNEPGTESSPVGPAIGAVVGALAAAIGVAVVAVLVLRAMTEWQTIEQRAAAAGTDPRASSGRRRS